MPANWPKFIPDLTNTLTSQKFEKPGGAGVSYEPPKVGAEVSLGKSVGPQKSILSGGKTSPGNPANAVLATNPAKMINANNTNLLSGRYDFGVQVAEHYLEATKNFAQTHVGDLHSNNGAAEKLLKDGYGWAFERLLREGDIPLQDQLDEDGNIVELGKESHPAYADFCPEVKEPDVEKILADNEKAFDKFLSEKRPDYNLYKFKFYEFPCLSGQESQEELEVIFATRILMGYKFMSTGNSRWDYFVWACHLGKENYVTSNTALNTSNSYRNINNRTRNDIEDANYDYKDLADNVSSYVKNAILAAHPVKEDDGNQTGTDSALKKRIFRELEKEIEFPSLIDSSGKNITPEFCPVNQYKIQVAHDFEEDSQRPKILTSNVVATFTYYPGKRTGGQPWVIDNENALFSLNTSGITWQSVEYEKTTNWVRSTYENGEWKNYWRKTPPAGRLKAAAESSDPTAAFLQLGWDGSGWGGSEAGTQYKFEYHRTLCAVKDAEKCEEEMAEVSHPWEESSTTPNGKSYSGDPYMQMARVTIAYWYACMVQPFKSTPPVPPALIPPPLQGIYVPIYYGSANRLANNLRRAWNTGKSFSKLPAKQPPSNATSVAVAGAYALHLLEFKLLYLGGIPTPAGPVPMVGFVPVVF